VPVFAAKVPEHGSSLRGKWAATFFGVPVMLGQTHFFMESAACFFRADLSLGSNRNRHKGLGKNKLGKYPRKPIALTLSWNRSVKDREFVGNCEALGREIH
jgi:hypothetical protein